MITTALALTLLASGPYADELKHQRLDLVEKQPSVAGSAVKITGGMLIGTGALALGGASVWIVANGGARPGCLFCVDFRFAGVFGFAGAVALLTLSVWMQVTGFAAIDEHHAIQERIDTFDRLLQDERAERLPPAPLFFAWRWAV
jgi:hypothetical protein